MNEKSFKEPIQRSGESIFAAIVRNRSGVCAGEIGCAIRHINDLELCESDKQDLVDSAYAIYESYMQQTGLKAKKVGNESGR